ncbi:MAG: DUF2652 domain-containing protein [Rhodothermaceae bacterium]
MTNALLFIPDISGFTKFVTHTAIEHSQIIIAKLLETIIEENRLDLEISEIEGDAILFFKKGEAPDFDELHNQAKTMFEKFHEFLTEMDKKNKDEKLCECEACTSVHDLSLKFVAHYGTLQEVKISSFKKLMGPSVILAHRLLKNNVPSKEYLLMTDEYLSQQKQNPLKEENLKLLTKITDEYDEFGEVESKYINFKELPRA